MHISVLQFVYKTISIISTINIIKYKTVLWNKAIFLVEIYTNYCMTEYKMTDTSYGNKIQRV